TDRDCITPSLHHSPTPHPRSRHLQKQKETGFYSGLLVRFLFSSALVTRAVELLTARTRWDNIRAARALNVRVDAVNCGRGLQRAGEADFPDTALRADAQGRSACSIDRTEGFE